MNVDRSSKHLLIIKSDENTFAFVLLLGFLGLVAYAAWLIWQNGIAAFDQERFQGALGGGVTLIVAFLVLFERSYFILDRRIQEIQWSRQRCWKKSSGIITFSAVKAITANTPIGDTGIPSRRISIRLQDHEIPLTVAFVPDHGDAQLKLAEEIRQFMGQPASGDDVMGSVQAAIQSGNTIEAIKLLRQAEDISLVEAKKRVEEMQRKNHNPSSVKPG